MRSSQFGVINVTSHHIERIPGTRAMKYAPYRAGPNARELEQYENSKQLAPGVIKYTYSSWASPVFSVPKKDGSLQFLIYYQLLNSVIVKDSYPILRMDHCIDSLGRAKLFSTLDAYSGHWQIPLNTEDSPKNRVYL